MTVKSYENTDLRVVAVGPVKDNLLQVLEV